jgi:hypothetical protein
VPVVVVDGDGRTQLISEVDGVAEEITRRLGGPIITPRG